MCCEMVSNRFIDCPKQTRLEKQHFAAFLRVMEQWPSNPEELGATLEEATANVDSWLQGDNRRQAMRRKTTAKARLRMYDGGQELIDTENKLRNL